MDFKETENTLMHMIENTFATQPVDNHIGISAMLGQA